MATRKPIALVSGYFQEVNTPTDKVDLAGNTTTDLAEGTRLYYTDARARGSITVNNTEVGYGSLSYVSSTGVLTYDVVTDANIRESLTVAAGSGLTYNDLTGLFSTSAIPNSQLANSSVTIGATTISLGSTSTTLAGLTSVSIGTAGATGSITLDSTGIVFEGSAVDTFETTLNVINPTVDQAINFPNASGTVALLTSLTGGNTGTGYGSLSYNNTTGAFTYSAVTDANIRGAVSAANSGTGYGGLTYSSSTGAFTYAVVTDADIRSSISIAVASGLTYNSTTGVLGTSAIPNSQLANSSITLGSTTVALGSTVTTISGLTSVAYLNAAQSFTAGQRGSITTLTDGATITADLATANNFSVTLGGNRTLANPSNQTAGQSGIIVITQDGTGGRTLAYGSNWKFPSGNAPTLTTTASAVDVLSYYVESASRITARLVNDVR
jgi:hypothetical protein